MISSRSHFRFCLRSMTMIIVLFLLSTPPAFSSELSGFKVVSETLRTITAYNVGDPDQTSGEPCLSATERNLCKALKTGKKYCAANFVPLGSFLYIEGYGVCRVSDRTNERFQNRVDIAMPKNARAAALEFGEQQRKVKILKKRDEPDEPGSS